MFPTKVLRLLGNIQKGQSKVVFFCFLKGGLQTFHFSCTTFQFCQLEKCLNLPAKNNNNNNKEKETET